MFPHVILKIVQKGSWFNSHGTMRKLHFKQFKYSAPAPTHHEDEADPGFRSSSLTPNSALSRTYNFASHEKPQLGAMRQGDFTGAAMGWDLAGSPFLERS